MFKTFVYMYYWSINCLLTSQVSILVLIITPNLGRYIRIVALFPLSVPADFCCCWFVCFLRKGAGLRDESCIFIVIHIDLHFSLVSWPRAAGMHKQYIWSEHKMPYWENPGNFWSSLFSLNIDFCHMICLDYFIEVCCELYKMFNLLTICIACHPGISRHYNCVQDRLVNLDMARVLACQLKQCMLCEMNLGRH